MAGRSRAEEIRDRRNSRKSSRKVKPRKDSGSSSLSARSLPPMVSRRGVMSNPAPQRTRKEARRRFNVSLPSAGAELALPAVPNVRVGWRVLSFLLVLGLGYGIYLMWSAPRFFVQDVTIEGLTRIPAHEIEAVLKVSGESILVIDPNATLERLQRSFPDLSDVKLEVGFPASVRVIGAEREPVLAWEQEGVTFWLDAGGYRFVPRGEVALPKVVAAEAPPVPYVIGEEIDEYWFTSPEMVSAILTLSTQAPEGTDLLYDPDHGLGWVDPKNGWNVYFGQRADQMNVRLSVYAAITKELKARGLKPAFISIENVHAPFFRMAGQGS